MLLPPLIPSILTLYGLDLVLALAFDEDLPLGIN